MNDQLPLRLASHALEATFSPLGAELQSLRHEGRELLWQADPKVWPRHAPILFPIVGRLPGDTLRHQGKSHPLSQHGFARDRLFELVERDGERALRFRLRDDAESRRHYPFPFVLEVGYRLEGEVLEVEYRIENPGTEPLYASIGGHPAFAWPLAGGGREGHVIEFEKREPAPIRRLEGGLLLPDPVPTPVEGNRLELNDALFEHDALIFDALESRRVRYSGPEGPAIVMTFDDFPHFGIWTKPGAGFVCLEPWHGHATPVGFDGEFATKPGLFSLAPGQARRWRYTIAVEPE